MVPESGSHVEGSRAFESSATILVADDLSYNVQILVDQLNYLGYRTITANDGPTALELCLREHPDLCILDIDMPAGSLGVSDRETGFEVCRRIKTTPETARIPVIFVTALNEASDRIMGIKVGGDDFLQKPHNLNVLKARVQSLLKLKAATDALESSNARLREMEKIRDDISKMIVHDLKSPLTGILANLEMVVDGHFGAILPEQKRALHEAENQAAELLALISDLLEVSRMEEAAIVLDTSPIDIRSFFEEIVNDWYPRFTQDNAKVNVVIEESVSTMQADRQLLKRVFSNLIQNSLTHSDRVVEITLFAKTFENDLILSVADNGVGIDPKYHEAIFQKFGKIKTGSVTRVRGSGLGLAFCKLVAEAHGGQIWVNSAPGSGSTFSLRFPVSIS